MNGLVSKRSLTMKSGKRGFTLIELLVVIAIIAILSAILFPVFAKVREKARQITCLSNEKQIGLGIMQYSEDNDETNPYVFGNNGTPDSSWETLVLPYIKSAGVFACPDDTYSRGATNVNSQGNSVPGTTPQISSYSMVLAWGDWGGTYSASGSKLASITSPSTTIITCERWNGYHFMDPGWAQDMWCNDGEFFGGQNGGPAAATGHTGGSNYSFCDGHAKWMRYSATVQQQGSEKPTTDPSFPSWLPSCQADTTGSATAKYFGMWTTQQN